MTTPNKRELMISRIAVRSLVGEYERGLALVEMSIAGDIAAYREELEAKHFADVTSHVLHILDDIEKRYLQSGDVVGLIALFRHDYSKPMKKDEA